MTETEKTYAAQGIPTRRLPSAVAAGEHTCLYCARSNAAHDPANVCAKDDCPFYYEERGAHYWDCASLEDGKCDCNIKPVPQTIILDADGD